MVRFIINPIIATLVGVLVGLLSKDHPASTSIVGLVLWALMMLGLKSAGTLRGNLIWVGLVSVYFLFAASAATLIWRLRHRCEDAKSENVTMGVTST